MPIQRSDKCAHCGHPKSDESSFTPAGRYADGSVKLYALCRSCQSSARKKQAAIRKRAGKPLPAYSVEDKCPKGHLKAENIRPGRYDCAACHREREMQRDRAAGAQPRTRLGETWTCGHDPRTDIRYVKGKPKGCKACHRDKQRLVPFNRERYNRYVEANREKVNAYRKAWKAANRPDQAEFSKGGPEAIAYARLITKDPCVYCGGPSIAIDHIVAVTKGGMGNWDNLAPVCKSCNSSKNNKDVLQFLMHRMKRTGALV